MGQTLTHGIYLPDEGERNCYNGLAGNWSVLDGAVGTIAEHSTQISGKAPLVHTHTKADITDLFNSANTWSGDNTYSKTVAIERSTDTGNFLALKNTVAELGSIPASATPVTIAYRDKNNDNLGYMGVYYDTDGSNHFRLYVRNKFTSGAPSTSGSPDYTFFGLRLNADKSKEGILRASFRPYDNNTYDLGTSSYQWNNLYAKNYYYNGVAWGLDKANTWSAHQKIVGSNSRGTVSIYNPAYTKGSTLSVTDLSIGSIFMGDGGQTGLANSLTFISTDLAASGAKTLLSLSAMENTESSATRTNVVIQYDKNDTANPKKVSVGGTLQPNPDATFSLGTSSFRWKTFNGVNPGALSLPDYNNALDVTSEIPIASLDGNTQIDINNYLPNKTGWLSIVIADTAGNFIVATQGRSGGSTAYNNSRTFHTGAQNNGYISVFFPILADMNKFVSIKASSLIQMRFYYCLGNV